MSNKSSWRELLQSLAGDVESVGVGGVFVEVPLGAGGGAPRATKVVRDGLIDLRMGTTMRLLPTGQYEPPPTFDSYRKRMSYDVTDALAQGDGTDGLPAGAEERTCIIVFDKDALAIKNATQQKRSSRFKSVETLERMVEEARGAPPPASSTAAAPVAAASKLVDFIMSIDDDDDDSDGGASAAAAAAAAPVAEEVVEPREVRRLLEELRVAREDAAHREACVRDETVLESPPPNTPLPRDIWQQITHDRAVRRPQLIRMASKGILTPNTPWAPVVPPGCSVIVDGHCLTLEAARRAFGPVLLEDEAARADAEALGDEAHTNVPLAGFRMPDGTYHVRFAYARRNAIAEADMSMFFHVAHDPAPRTIVHSRDSDILLIAMLYVEAARRRQQLGGDGDGATPTNLYVTYPLIRRGEPPRAVYFDANAMCQAVHAHPQFGNMTNAVETLVATLVAGGSDYTANFSGVPYHHFYGAAKKLATAAATTTTVTASSAAAAAAPVAPVAPALLAPDGVTVRVEGLERLVDEAYRTATRAGRKPERSELQYRAKHISYVMRVWTQPGARDVVVPDPLDFGYALADAAAPPTASNIVAHFTPLGDREPPSAAKRARRA